MLHYARRRDAELRAGELCLIDAGCELDGYASDITRTFPADGRFSAPQRELYDIVEAAQRAADRRDPARRAPARRPRRRGARARRRACSTRGLLDRNAVGDVDAVIESAAYRQFYMHGTGHWLGRDVHDVGDYQRGRRGAGRAARRLGGRVVKKPSRVLEPGMVVTIEPGLYVRPGRRRARALLEHRHPHRGRRRRHRRPAAS